MLLAAHLVAVVHAAAVVLMLLGGLVALRRPGVLRVHVPVALAIAGVYLAGADCPLTDLEQALRARAGAPPYQHGFLGHYVLTPLGLDRGATATQVGLLAAAVVPNAVAVAIALRRRAEVSRSGRRARMSR